MAIPAPTVPAIPVSLAGTAQTTIDAYARTLKRATACKVVVYRTNDRNVFAVPSISDPGAVHTVRFVGPRWHDLTCDCRGGTHPACMHRAATVFALKYRCFAVRPQPAPVVSSPATPPVGASTRLDIPTPLDELFS